MDNLLHFPPTTIVNKHIPKNSFWQRSERPSELKEFLTKEFECITWLYKLSPSTLNVEEGQKVREITVFHCLMKNSEYNIISFRLIDSLLPRHTIFLIEYHQHFDILMHHKEKNIIKNEERWTCGECEVKKNINLSEDILNIHGLNMDVIYSGFLSQISGLSANNEEQYKELILLRKQIDNLQKQISTLQKRIRLEKQFNKQIELNTQVRKLKKDIISLKDKLNK